MHHYKIINWLEENARLQWTGNTHLQLENGKKKNRHRGKNDLIKSKNMNIHVCFAPNLALMSLLPPKPLHPSPHLEQQYHPETERCLEKELAHSGYRLKSFCCSLSWHNFCMRCKLNKSLNWTGICMGRKMWHIWNKTGFKTDNRNTVKAANSLYLCPWPHFSRNIPPFSCQQPKRILKGEA